MTTRDNMPTPAGIASNVTLVCTVYREARTIVPFLGSVFAMRLCPGEMVIVDGGSDDGTVESIREFLGRTPHATKVEVAVDPRCNRRMHVAPIALGRNVAVGMATGEIIAVTDAGCRLDTEWLAEIVAPFAEGENRVDAVRGAYRIDARTYFEECAALLWNSPEPKRGSARFIPSSRSFAFRKSAWRKVGGYPERSYTGEDTGFVLLLEGAGCRMADAFGAVVYWRMRSDIGQFVKLFYLYGHGDGYNGLLFGNVLRNGAKLSASGFLLALSLLWHPGFLALLVLYLWLLPFWQKPREAVRGTNLHKLPLTSLLKIVADATYIVGYAAGALARVTARSAP